MLDNTTAHTAHWSMLELREVYDEQVIYQWPPCSPDLKPCDFYLWGILKDEIYINNLHMTRETEGKYSMSD
jgi:hypothetical protein